MNAPASFPAALLALLLASACGSRGSPTGEVRGLASPSGSASEILEREQMNPAAITMEELLRQRLPNVMIRRSGERSWIQIRGQTSIHGSNEALIIVDGIEVSSRGLLTMNPDDVERVQVLKDGSAAIYGMRAANGVLVVTTRRE